MAHSKSRLIHGLGLLLLVVLAGATAVDGDEEEELTVLWEDDDDRTLTPAKNTTDPEIQQPVDPCASFTDSSFDETTGKCICNEEFACLHFEKIQNGRIFATPCALGQVTRRRVKGKQIFIKHDLIPINCSSCFCKATGEKNRQVRGRMIFATVPRSGNSWMRRMLERASHLPTETVYRGERVKKRPRSEAQYVALDGRAPFSADTGLFEQPCGMDNNCDQVYVRNCTASTVIAKTHSPFLQQMHARYHKHAGSDVGIGASALVSVRNPLDNFDAWYRYTGAKGNFSAAEGGRDVNFKAFLEDWTEHNQYWLSNAVHHQVPSIFYRYEDLTIDKCRFNIIKSALQESGLWSELLLSDYDVNLSSKDMQPNQGVESKLSQAQGKSGHSYPKADIELALKSPLVKLFGYEKLYKSWLNPDEDDGETEHDWENGENCVYRLP